MDHDKNKHCVETAYSCLYHYKNTPDANWRACGEQDDATRVELTPKSQTYPRLAFEMPRQRHELAQVLLLMEKSYEVGRRDNRVELAVLLRDLIAI